MTPDETKVLNETHDAVIALSATMKVRCVAHADGIERHDTAIHDLHGKVEALDERTKKGATSGKEKWGIWGAVGTAIGAIFLALYKAFFN